MKRLFVLALALLLSLTGCSDSDGNSLGSETVDTDEKTSQKVSSVSRATTMPYSSDEYENGDWTVDELVAHFEDLGFTFVEVYNVYDTFDKEKAGICGVVIEDTSAGTFSTSYRDIEKGEKIRTWSDIRINVITLIPTITVENCPEFAELVKMDRDLPQKEAAIDSFMMEHRGEYIELDGTITWWCDTYFWISVDLAVDINIGDQTFTWYSMSFSEMGLSGKYDFEKYKAGMIVEGTRVHVITKIGYSDDSWKLRMESMQILEE